MKKWILIVYVLLAGITSFAQDKMTICHTAPTEKFAILASNRDFRLAHPTPRLYVHLTQAGGKMITFPCTDGKAANGYVLMAAKKTDNWIFVFQEWWGLNDNIKRQSEDLFRDLGNVNVLALDMYDGQVATDADHAQQFMQAFTQERGNAIVKGALAYVGKKAKVATIGWCFGGGQSLLASLGAEKQAAACVVYYGMPVDDVEVLKTLNADVLGIFAGKDKWINPETVRKFEANMKKAGKKIIVKNYDANHGFANPSNPLGFFDEPAYKDSYAATLEFFKARLK